MKMTNLSWPPPNMNLIREVCASLGKDSLTFLLGYWLTPVVWSHTPSGEERDFKPSFEMQGQQPVFEALSCTVYSIYIV